MKLFRCQKCGQILYFENHVCERCSHTLGYLPDESRLAALEPAGEGPAGGLWRTIGRDVRTYRFCANAGLQACNWLIEQESEQTYCVCCRHNRTVPDLGNENNLVAWRKLEAAKHRLFYSLLRFGLPTEDRPQEPVRHLAFDFLADPPDTDTSKVMTGHDNGLITITIDEADDAEREKRRESLHES